MARDTRTGLADVRAGCFTCAGLEAMWTGKNAMGVAARHHDSTGHPTWCDQLISVRYGRSLFDRAEVKDRADG